VTRRVSILLLAAGGWTLFIWVTRLVNMAGEDRSAGFYVVHGVLAVISIAFGVVVGVVGWRALRAPSR
jgi:NADH:ubiquinone oxidoreductase subunit 2 (subunit N)